MKKKNWIKKTIFYFFLFLIIGSVFPYTVKESSDFFFRIWKKELIVYYFFFDKEEYYFTRIPYVTLEDDIFKLKKKCIVLELHSPPRRNGTICYGCRVQQIQMGEYKVKKTFDAAYYWGSERCYIGSVVGRLKKQGYITEDVSLGIGGVPKSLIFGYDEKKKDYVLFGFLSGFNKEELEDMITECIKQKTYDRLYNERYIDTFKKELKQGINLIEISREIQRSVLKVDINKPSGFREKYPNINFKCISRDTDWDLLTALLFLKIIKHQYKPYGLIFYYNSSDNSMKLIEQFFNYGYEEGSEEKLDKLIEKEMKGYLEEKK